MFAWPLNPDVIAVGAVNPERTQLLECSRVGDPAAGVSGLMWSLRHRRDREAGN